MLFTLRLCFLLALVASVAPLWCCASAIAQPFAPTPQANLLRSEAGPPQANGGNGANGTTPPPPELPQTESEGGDDGSPAAPAARQPLTQEQVQTRLEAVDTLGLSEDEVKRAKAFYQEAIQATIERDRLLKQAQEKAAEYQPVDDPKYPDRPPKYSKEWYQNRLSRPIEEVLGLTAEDLNLQNAPTEVLEEKAKKREEYFNKWSKIVKDLEAAPAVRKQFIGNAPTKRQQIEQQLATIDDELEQIGQDGISSEVTIARGTALLQREAKLKAELQAVQAQREAYARAEAVYELDLELAQRKADKYAELLAKVRSELSERRLRAASQQVRAAQQAADRNKQLIERNESSLGELSAYNQSLTEERQDLVSEHNLATAEYDETIATSNTVEATFENFELELGDEARLSQASGQLLREQRTKLPRVSQLRADILRLTNRKNDLGLRRFEAEQQRIDLTDMDAAVREVLDNVREEDRQQAEPVVRTLLANQLEYLKSYTESVTSLETQLSELISAKERLLENTEQFRDFIAERDLWIRSSRPLWATQIKPGREADAWRPFYLRPAIEALAWSFHPANWLQALSDLQAAAYRQPLLTAMIIVTFLLMLYAQQKARSQIRLLGEEAAKRTCTDFLPSFRTLWLTLVVSLPWPLLLLGIGWLLEGPLIEAEFTRALSLATRYAAWILLLTEFLRQSCRTNGLAEAHLGWPRPVLAQLRRYLRWVPALVVPSVFWMVGLDVQTTQQMWSASLGRVLFLVVIAYTTFTLYRLLMKPSSALYQLLERGSDNWLISLGRVWRPALVAVPIVLGVMAALGYYYTAEQLGHRVVATAAMLLGLMIAGGLLRRWVLLNRRKLAREQARQRRAQAQAAAAEGDEIASLVDVPEDVVDLTAVSEQTHKLLRMLLVVCGVVGSLLIWQDMFPALAWLEKNPLPWVDGDDPTTWGHLLRCLVAVVLTYFAARDIPGLLELVVLQHLPIDQGARYAISTLARYGLLIIGIVVAAALLGITGTSISWLVAAMGVGLGFGLQEIFANFVSGIILLFERPIRVGDIITLGDKTGVVSRIRMRATTITDWDRKEYVVPNKDLVTERLLNWTLSDPTNRVTIQVGIAYGSDTDKAVAILREIVDAHPEIMDDPAALITFEGFGDSTLNLVVRCYLPNLEKRLMTIHELHTAINKRFNAEGIEIAFPQRDLHIRSVPQGWEPRPAGDLADKPSTNGQHDQPTPADKAESN